MSREPQYQLDPRIKAVWRISDVIVITLIALCVALVGIVAWLADADTHSWSGIYMLICLVVWAVAIVVDLVAITPFRYARWRYQLFPTFLKSRTGLFGESILWSPLSVYRIRILNRDQCFVRSA